MSIGLIKSYQMSSSHHPHTVARLCYQFNHVFAVLISIPHFMRNNFYQARPNIELLLQKNCKIFEGWGLRPQTPNGFRPPETLLSTQKHSPFISNFRLCIWLVVSTGNANALQQNFCQSQVQKSTCMKEVAK